MRKSLGRVASSNNCTKQTLIPTCDFSTFVGGGGRGRGRGSSSGPPKPPFTAQSIGKGDEEDAVNGESDDAFVTSGVGRGRGKPILSTPITSSFTPWIPGINPSSGRGGTNQPPHAPPQESQPKKAIFFRRENDSSESSIQKIQFSELDRNSEESVLPSSLLAGLSGAGRGKPVKHVGIDERPSEENRHIRRRPDGAGLRRGGAVQQLDKASQSSPKLSREEAAQKAIEILSRGGGRGAMEEQGGRGRGLRDRGGRGRGGRGAQGWRGRGGRGRGRFQDSEDDFASGLYLGDNADGERLAKRVGVENMDKLVEAFEEMSGRVLPSPMDDAYLDALHTNNLLEYEPEYLMEVFGTNPDIDERPPISLRDALEKIKPFMMAYEGIQSQEEWEEIMKEVMEKLPYMKQLIDIYSGPDRVTAKQQQEELERVAKTLPDNVPSSVKRFTDRAVLSLQSNPGWGFDKKCQFMDKLVWEVSQSYK